MVCYDTSYAVLVRDHQQSW